MLRCDHPDIEAFIEAKRAPGALSHFNLSVLLSDAFMHAVHRDDDWPLLFPAAALPGPGRVLQRQWPGHAGKIACRVVAVRRARALWRRLTRAAWAGAEPGVLFIDRINRENNLAPQEYISATNPCGELPLPPYGACHLGSLNLTRFVREPFTARAAVDHHALAMITALAVRMLDNAITIGRYPLAAQRTEALAKRRVGLGVTGLADALVMLGLPYASDAGRAAAVAILTTVRDHAYRASAELAREKGAFPAFAAEAFLAQAFPQRLPAAIRDLIARHGLRNSHLLAIAPAGSISLLAGNVSAGIEPVFSARQERAIHAADGRIRVHRIDDYACRLWRQTRRGLPPALVDATAVPPSAHLAMQAALQPLIDNAISKTVNMPAASKPAAFARIYASAFDLGLKGITAFRPNAMRGAVLACVDKRCGNQ
jgi:ribonucleoside-diphosphate reductase alpha chain